MKTKRSSLWKTVVRDRWLILLCMVLSFLTWQGIRKNIGNEIPVSDVLVDVEVPEGWAVWEKSLSRVNILFHGSREDMLYLNNEQLKVTIPIDKPVASKEITIKLSDKFLKNPTDSQVVRFNPPEISIRLDQEVEKMLPVKATLEDAPPSGFEVDRIICSPLSIKVSGAKQVLDEMQSIFTTPIRLKDQQADFKVRIPIALPEGARIRIEPEWVSVEVQLAEQSDERTFENLPVQILSPPGDDRLIKASPPTVSLTIKGRPEHLEQLTPEEVFVIIASKNLTEYAGYDLPVEVRLPASLTLATKAPVVHIEISKP